MKIHKMVHLGLLTAAALIMFFIEMQLPPLAPIPGVKLGLANVITLVVLSFWGWREALVVLMLRIVLGNIFSGQVMSFFYSFGGGSISFAVMAMGYYVFKDKGIIWLSVLGALTHMLGQLLVAWILFKSASVLVYLPIYVVAGGVTGFFTGNVVQQLLDKKILQKSRFISRRTI